MRRASFSFQKGAALASVEQFLAEVRAFSRRGDHQLYFRGHGSASPGLLPSIGRQHFYAGQSITFDPRTEQKLLDQFRRHAYQHFGRVPTEWEVLFLARHYGMPTRLLDWTSNPLVALYFAAYHGNEEPVFSAEIDDTRIKLDLDGTLWGVQRRDGIAELDVFRDDRPPLKIPGIKLVLPFNPTPRMAAQSGIFTLHGNPWQDMVQSAGKSFPAQDLDIAKLIRWHVPSKHKADIVLELERLAINSRTLFPDLEGLARGLWQTEIIRKGLRRGRSENSKATNQPRGRTRKKPGKAKPKVLTAPSRGNGEDDNPYRRTP